MPLLSPHPLCVGHKLFSMRDVFIVRKPIHVFSPMMVLPFFLLHFCLHCFLCVFLNQEQLDGAGVELPSLFKWIESQAPNGCSTEAWRKRTHWVGSQVTNDVTEFVSDAEKYLQSHRPVRRYIIHPFQDWDS